MKEEVIRDPLGLDQDHFKAYVVSLILNKDTERAVELVSAKHRVRKPKLSIGISKGKKKALGVYSVDANTISFKDNEQFFNPFVVLHEMYHCVRSTSGIHRGNEKNADRFAIDYIQTFNKLASQNLDLEQFTKESVD